MENVENTQQTPLIELDLLKTLVAIADTGNFTAAAESIFRTPSAVSMQIKRLEDMVGKPLFTRDSRSVLPTPDGENLLEHGRRMLALNREMVGQFMSPEVAGTVKLGAPDHVVELSMPTLLRRFAETHCCVNVDVFIDHSENLRKRVKNREIDLCLYATTPEAAKRNGAEVLLKEPLVWAGAKNGVACEKVTLPISVWDEGCSWRSHAIERLIRAKRDYRIAFMSAHIAGQRSAMLADLAVAPVPLSACVNGLVDLSECGLPKLKDYVLAIEVRAKAPAAVEAAADHLRASYL